MVSVSYFYNYGKVALSEEIGADIEVCLLTDQRSQFYYRDYGAGLSAYEGQPINIASEIAVRYAISNAVAKRNMDVSMGLGYADRRAVTSQSAISLSQTESGTGMEANVPYIQLSDMQTTGNVVVALTGR